MSAARLGALLASMTLAASACDSSHLFDPALPQGIDGTALIGPQCPVQSQANPCPDLPHQAWIDVLDADLDFVVRIRSETDGTFRVGLEPGSYVLSPEGGTPFPAVSAQDVTVLEEEFTDVVVRFDTGIR
ncbi:MAG: hypothetical protein AAF389_07520 [Gemmatimonadota bacterium]